MDIVQVMQAFGDRINHRTLRKHICRGDVDAVVRCAKRLQRRYYSPPRPIDRIRHYNPSMTIEGVLFTLGEAALPYVIIDELLVAISAERNRMPAEIDQLLAKPPAAV
ncbi:MAG: hypothetical protein ABIR91_00455 [Candidatus Saccharimonadales bacterium]